jgi:Flp pilus assembly protein TadD
LAYSETLLGGFLKENNKLDFQIHFNQARTLYKKAEKLERDYPLLYSNWSVLEFYEGNYAQAQLKLATAKKLGYEPDPAYEKALKEKL